MPVRSLIKCGWFLEDSKFQPKIETFTIFATLIPVLLRNRVWYTWDILHSQGCHWHWDGLNKTGNTALKCWKVDLNLKVNADRSLLRMKTRLGGLIGSCDAFCKGSRDFMGGGSVFFDRTGLRGLLWPRRRTMVRPINISFFWKTQRTKVYLQRSIPCPVDSGRFQRTQNANNIPDE